MDFSKDKYEIYELLMRLLEGDLNDEQRKHLISWSRSELQAVEIYGDFIKDQAIICAKIANQVDEYSSFSDSIFDQTAWKALQKEELTAPTIKMQKDLSRQGTLIQNVVRPKVTHRVNKFSLYSVIASTAAFFCVFVSLFFTTPDRSPVEIAHMADGIDVKWAGGSDNVKIGDAISSSYFYTLSKGVIEIQTKRGVTLTVEGPAEFAFTRQADMSLYYGRIYARVSPQGRGFTVNTDNSKVIDFGTEFGVRADVDGSTELHVIEGETMLVFGMPSKRKTSIAVLAGDARSVVPDGTKALEIPLRQESFARVIDSKKNFLWRGKPSIDLADIVGGGNGFGTGKIGSGVSITSGKIEPFVIFEGPNLDIKHKQLYYRQVSESPLIDGVFLPDGGLGDVVVSSQGHIFKDCPDTNGFTNRPALNGGDRIFEVHEVNYPLMIQNQVCGTKEYPALCMVSNSGLTIDLQKIRSAVPGLRPVAFKAESAFSSNVSVDNADASVYVLIDGQVKYIDNHVTVRPKNIHVPIKQKDRFLTVITTDNGSTESDWVLYGRPHLELAQ